MDYKRKLELSKILINEIFDILLTNYDERISKGVERYKDFPFNDEATTRQLSHYYQRMGLRYNDIVFSALTQTKISEQYPDEIQEIWHSPSFQTYLQWGINTDILKDILEKLKG